MFSSNPSFLSGSSEIEKETIEEHRRFLEGNLAYFLHLSVSGNKSPDVPENLKKAVKALDEYNNLFKQTCKN